MQHSWRPLSNLDPAYRIRCSAGWSSCPELCGHCTNMGSRPSARTNWSVMWHPIEVGGLSRWQSPKHPPRLDLSTASHSDVPCSLIAFWKMMSDSYHIYTVYTSILYRWSYLQLWIPEASPLSLFLPLGFGMGKVAAKKKNSRWIAKTAADIPRLVVIFGSHYQVLQPLVPSMTLPVFFFSSGLPVSLLKLVNDNLCLDLISIDDSLDYVFECDTSRLACHFANEVFWHRIVMNCRTQPD